MTRVVVRVPTSDYKHVLLTLLRALGDRPGVVEKIDQRPPASGPEVEFTLTGLTVDEVRDAIEAQGISVLAIRESVRT